VVYYATFYISVGAVKGSVGTLVHAFRCIIAGLPSNHKRRFTAFLQSIDERHFTALLKSIDERHFTALLKSIDERHFTALLKSIDERHFTALLKSTDEHVAGWVAPSWPSYHATRSGLSSRHPPAGIQPFPAISAAAEAKCLQPLKRYASTSMSSFREI
jgi:hypothetical protein